MATSSGIEIIALEEHYWDKVVTDTFVGRNASRRGALLDRLGALSLSAQGFRGGHWPARGLRCTVVG